MMKQQEEINLVYEKYGTSMTGGCLPMLIQMPILFALYPVIRDIPTYVKGVKDVTGQVLESQLNTFYKVEGSSSSVNAPEVEKTVVSTVIYSISGAVQSELAPGLNFVRTTYSDGTVEVEKVIKK